MTRDHRSPWMAKPDGGTAREIRRELGWTTGSSFLTFDRLLEEAERRYWQNRSTAVRTAV